MKRIILSVLLTGWLSCSFAQTTTGKITGLKDAWGESITYIGEIKNKQPNGIGVAIYNNDHALRYAGNFVNGMYQGKGTMLFKNGAFLTGDWKNGKLNGKGCNLTVNGNIYMGPFSDGKREGKGNLIYSDNSILQGEWRNDKFNGRSIYIPASAATVSDNIYVDDKKNGTGYQYEIDNKKLFQGIWKDGDWQSATTDNYKSFLTNTDFYAEKTDKQVLLGTLNSSTRLMADTGFFYDLVNKKRYFGVYKNGMFDNGVVERDDSTRYIGALNKQGLTGYCNFYKVANFYEEGMYVNDFLNGPGSLSIDLKKKSVYYGQADEKGFFTGKAWFVNNQNDIYNGDYVKGRFTGNGFKINERGYCLKATWDDGYPVTVSSLTDEKGAAVSLAPKSLAEAIALVTKQATADLDLLKGKEESEGLYDLMPKSKSIIAFPLGLKKDYIQEDIDYNVNYIAPYLVTTDFAKAKAKYNELSKQVTALKIILDKGTPAFTLDGKPTDPDETIDTNACIFEFPSKDGIPYGYAVSVVMVKDDSGNYTVEIVLGDKDSTVVTGDE
jgi:hypothetical protein